MPLRNSVTAKPTFVVGAATLLFSTSFGERISHQALQDLHNFENRTEGKKRHCKPSVGETTPSKECDTICRRAAEAVPQPYYPIGFFGGLGEKERDAIAFTEGKYIQEIGGCSPDWNVDCFDIKKIDEKTATIELDKVRGEKEGSFAFPMQTSAYFTCYSRGGKWPIFETWKIKADLQSDDKAAREGDFKVFKSKDLNYEVYHKNIKDEYLRTADVDGHWSNFFALDQGHWCPDAAFRGNKEFVSDTYYFINISPQSSCLNRGNWMRLEGALREKAFDDKRAALGPSEPDEEPEEEQEEDEEDEEEEEEKPTRGRKKKTSSKKKNSLLEVDAPRKKKGATADKSWQKEVTEKYDIDVIAGPVQEVPEEFLGKDLLPHWKDLFGYWRDAGEVLMSNTYPGSKYPHWVDITWKDGNKPGRCILRGDLANPRRDALFPEYLNIPTCNLDEIVTKEMLPKLSLFLMVEAGSKRTRRGVRIPLVYYKVATFSDDKWCCWMLDQLDNVFPSNDRKCLQTVAENSFGAKNPGDLDILPDAKKYAGDERCAAIFQKKESKSVDCGFHNQGIDWRGQYQLEEAHARYDDLKKELEKVMGEKGCEGKPKVAGMEVKDNGGSSDDGDNSKNFAPSATRSSIVLAATTLAGLFGALPRLF
mmetsp:Transcript_96213/g.200986  ORF Transcript_96213/g.200986 Transcript_96213/m.200986 type:complete len:648 (-) Transcript_96213:250-2193(-)